MVLGSLSSTLRRRSCELVWLVCFIQVSVILFYSHRSLDPPRGQNQQDDPSIQNQQENTAKRNQDRPAAPPRGEEAGEPGAKGQNPGGEAVGPGGKELQQCPGTAPLLGKTRSLSFLFVLLLPILFHILFLFIPFFIFFQFSICVF